MPIKKLIYKKSPSTKFVLEANEGIVVFHDGHEHICLYLQSPQVSDLEKFEKFQAISNLKYIGDNCLMDFVSHLSIDPIEPVRKVFTNPGQEVIYYSDSGKVRFKKLDSKKNVLIVDDSKTIQKLLSKIIKDSESLNLIGLADCPSQAKKVIESGVRIDLITLDIHMPEMNGVEFLRTYLGKKKIPTVMISSVSIDDGPLVMEALSLGAYSYIQKPSVDKLAELKDDIIQQLETVADIGPQKNATKQPVANVGQSTHFESLEGLIAIGSSTGGTLALQEIFTSLPSQIPPIVVVQHIPAVFSKALAERLNTLCPFTVKEAEDSEFLQKNTIYIAPGDKQMKLVKRGDQKKIVITNDPPLNRFRPSVDYLFESLPALSEKSLVGVILTGMGRDGAKGLLEIHKSGAFTLAQDELTSVVFGMPKEAIAIGAANKVVGLPDMAQTIVQEFNKITVKKAV